MTKLFHDPLLGIATIVLSFLIAIFAFVTVVLGVGAIAAPFVGPDLVTKLVDGGTWPLQGDTIWLISLLLAGIALIMGLLTWFLLLLWRIRGTVRSGDPFVPENARRLAAMGWVALAGNVLGWLMGALGEHIVALAAAAGQPVVTGQGVDFGAGGLLLVLTLFILARVFRHGAAMREDLEGTV